MASLGVIRFDSEYMRSRAKIVTQAGEAVDDAIESLRKANRHDGWRCAERAEINKKLDEIKKRLEKIKDNAVTPVAAALSRGAEQFAELETRSVAQEKQIARQMREDFGYKPTAWERITRTVSDWWSRLTGGGGDIIKVPENLPVTPIPSSPDTRTAKPSRTESEGITLNLEPPAPFNWKPPSKLMDWISKNFSLASD